MLKVDLATKKFEKLKETELKQEKILERYDLQQLIVNSWETFKNEIGIPAALFIGQEINPHESVQDSMDILAFDQNDSSLIIIELKRDKNKLQLLQSLTYAAMISNWDSDKILSNIKNIHQENSNEVKEIIANAEISDEIKIILLAEYYDPEVIITADWLTKQYKLNITAFSISLHKINDQLILDTEQKYPLKELTESYEPRRKINNKKIEKNITWEDVIPHLKYDFAKEGITLCRKYREGDPKRRRFGDIKKNHDGFNWISLNFREKYINVYTGIDNKNEGSNKIIDLFGDKIEISEWRDGISFLIRTRAEYEKLKNWLQL